MPNRPINLEPYSAPYLTNKILPLAKACDNDPMIYRKMTPAELVKIDILNDKAFSAAKKLPADYPILMIAGTQDAMFKSNELPKGIEKFGTHNVSLLFFQAEAICSSSINVSISRLLFWSMVGWGSPLLDCCRCFRSCSENPSGRPRPLRPRLRPRKTTSNKRRREQLNDHG